MQYGVRFVLPHYKGSVSGMDTQVERVTPPPPSPHQLWAGQETRKEADLQVQRWALPVEGNWVSSKRESLPPGQARGQQAGAAAVVKALKGTACPGQ